MQVRVLITLQRVKRVVVGFLNGESVARNESHFMQQSNERYCYTKARGECIFTDKRRNIGVSVKSSVTIRSIRSPMHLSILVITPVHGDNGSLHLIFSLNDPNAVAWRLIVTLSGLLEFMVGKFVELFAYVRGIKFFLKFQFRWSFLLTN